MSVRRLIDLDMPNILNLNSLNCDLRRKTLTKVPIAGAAPNFPFARDPPKIALSVPTVSENDPSFPVMTLRDNSVM